MFHDQSDSDEDETSENIVTMYTPISVSANETGTMSLTSADPIMPLDRLCSLETLDDDIATTNNPFRMGKE